MGTTARPCTAVYKKAGKTFPQEPLEQMRLGAYAVFDSWNSDRAKKYMVWHLREGSLELLRVHNDASLEHLRWG